MSRDFPQLTELRLTVGDDVRERHLDAIADAIDTEGRPRLRRLRLLAVAAVLVLVFPVLALAAERSVPGDFLYPLKTLVEPVVEMVDPDLRARHRVTEVERLYDRGAERDLVSDHAETARDVIGDDYPELTERIDRVLDEMDSAPGQGSDAPDDQQPASRQGGEGRSGEGVTSTSEAGRHDDSATTTVPRETDTTGHRGDGTTQAGDREP